MCPTMAMCGIQMSLTTGLRIAMETGYTSLTTVGLGLATSRGVGLHITMAAGCGPTADGAGGRDQWVVSTVRSGRRRTFRSGAGAEASDSGSAGAVGAVSAGSRSDLVTGSTRGGVDTAAASVR